MMRAMIRNALILATMTVSLSACKYVDPCTTLPPPTPVEVQAAAGGAEVEREVGRTECIVQSGKWTNGANVKEA